MKTLYRNTKAGTARPAVPTTGTRFMRIMLFACFMAGLWHPLSCAAAETTNSLPNARSLDAFKIISERNIFNANRRLLSATPTTRTERPPRIESFTLKGTFLHDGLYAIFEGTEFRGEKILKPGDVIVGHKIIEVMLNGVKLEGKEGNIELPRGMQMRKREDEPWQVVADTTSTASSGSSLTSSSDSGRRDRGSETGRRDRGAESNRRDRGFDRRGAGADSERSARPGTEARPAEESTGGSSPNDILQRMMQRRAQETNR